MRLFEMLTKEEAGRNLLLQAIKNPAVPQHWGSLGDYFEETYHDEDTANLCRSAWQQAQGSPYKAAAAWQAIIQGDGESIKKLMKIQTLPMINFLSGSFTPWVEIIRPTLPRKVENFTVRWGRPKLVGPFKVDVYGRFSDDKTSSVFAEMSGPFDCGHVGIIVDLRLLGVRTDTSSSLPAVVPPQTQEIFNSILSKIRNNLEGTNKMIQGYREKVFTSG